MGNSSSSSAGTESELFAKQSPDLLLLVLPLRLLWHALTRRLGVLATRWPDQQPGASEPQAAVVVSGLVFGETPRFRPREQALYFSDMLGKQILKYALATKQAEVVYEDREDFVSGIGWLPDDTLLVVSMQRRQLLAVDPPATRKPGQPPRVYADLQAVTQYRANDLVVASSGRAYVGNFGFDHAKFHTCCSTTLVSVDPQTQKVRVEATKLLFPNGAVLTPDGKTLIVGETFGGRLTAFDVAEDGALANRRVWAHVGCPVDGICLDAEGCVWVSVPQIGIYESLGGALLRIKEGGEVRNMLGLRRNGIRHGVIACQLATDASTGEHLLFFLEAPSCKDEDVFKHGHDKPTRLGELKAIPVPVGPALMPSNPNYCGGYC